MIRDCQRWPGASLVPKAYVTAPLAHDCVANPRERASHVATRDSEQGRHGDLVNRILGKVTRKSCPTLAALDMLAIICVTGSSSCARGDASDAKDVNMVTTRASANSFFNRIISHTRQTVAGTSWSFVV